MVGQPQAELAVHLCLVGGVGLGEGDDDVAEGMDKVGDLVATHAACADGLVVVLIELGLGADAFGLGLGDPRRDERRVAASVEDCPVAFDLGVAFGDDGLRAAGDRADEVGTVLVDHGGDGLLTLVGCEDLDQPGVDRTDDRVLSHDDVARVSDLVGQRVLLGETAAVVGRPVRVLALHLALTHGAVDRASKDVGVAGAVLLVFAAACAASAGEDVLGAGEGVVVDERLVRQGLGGDPLVGFVPAHDAGVPHRHVLDVHQDLVGALLVPDLPPGVAGVGQDGADRALGPGDPGAVPVASGVVRRR